MRKRNRNRVGTGHVNYSALEPRQLLATITVDTLLDDMNPVADGLVSLREAITAANTDAAFLDAPAGSGADRIEFSRELSGQVITLDGAELKIESGVTIRGDVTIDANGLSRHFRVLSGSAVLHSMTLENGAKRNGGSVYLNNGTSLRALDVTFNNNAAVGGNGGAVYSEGGFFVVNGSNFNSNVAASSGGAIYSANGNTNISNATFVDNHSSNSAGAVEFKRGFGTVANSSFSNVDLTTGPESGGFVSAGEFVGLEVRDSTFEGGIANLRGGAIESYGRAKIFGGTFTDNSARNDNGVPTFGGAIFATKQLTIDVISFFEDPVEEAVLFQGNDATNGGAIHTQQANLFIGYQVEFNENTARFKGGALNIEGGETTTYGASFTNNTALAQGGAIAVRGVELEIVNPFFSFNTAGRKAIFNGPTFREGHGGAIYASNSEVTVDSWRDGTEFRRNTAFGTGGAISLTGGELSISSRNLLEGPVTEFHFNTLGGVNVDPDEVPVVGGGAIYVKDAPLNIESAVFRSNDANMFPGSGGGAIFLTNSNAEVSNSRFISNRSSSEGGGVTVGDGADLKLTDSWFANNQAKLRGGGISVTENGRLTTLKTDFVQLNRAEFQGGGAIFNEGSVRVRDAQFRDSRSGTYEGNARGGAILNLGDAAILSADFIGNNNYGSGGAIFSGGSLFLSNGRLDNNIALSVENPDAFSVGGAIFSRGETQLANLQFTSNTAESGGAIYANAGTVYANRMTFGGPEVADGNRAISANPQAGNGGAVGLGSTGQYRFGNTWFQNNQASDSGGALNVDGSDASLVMFGRNLFAENFIVDEDLDGRKVGGAIAVHSGLVEVRNGIFERNRAIADGGAVFISENGDATIRGSLFDANVSLGSGGGLFNAGTMLGVDSTFSNNESEDGEQLAFDSEQTNTRLIRVNVV